MSGWGERVGESGCDGVEVRVYPWGPVWGLLYKRAE